MTLYDCAPLFVIVLLVVFGVCLIAWIGWLAGLADLDVFCI